MRGAVAGDQVGRGRRFQMQRECCVWGREWVQRSDPQVRKGHSGGADRLLRSAVVYGLRPWAVNPDMVILSGFSRKLPDASQKDSVGTEDGHQPGAEAVCRTHVGVLG